MSGWVWEGGWLWEGGLVESLSWWADKWMDTHDVDMRRRGIFISPHVNERNQRSPTHLIRDQIENFQNVCLRVRTNKATWSTKVLIVIHSAIENRSHFLINKW